MTNTETTQSTVTDGPEDVTVEHPFRQFVGMYMRNYAAVFGLFVFVTIVGAALFAPLILDLDPFEMVDAPLLAPGEGGHIFGTDNLGRDLFVAVVYGARVTMAVGGAAAAITLIIGLSIGAMAGYYRGWVDEVLMRITEFFQVLPPLLLAMVLVALFSPTLETVAIAIGVVSWTAVARLARSEFLRIRSLDYIKAARSISSSNRRIIWFVILPNAMPPLVVQATLAVGGAILFEAGLSFLGLADPNVMSWGFMIGSSRDYLMDAWWTVTIPGIFIFLTVLAVSLIGDGLNDATNPKLRER